MRFVTVKRIGHTTLDVIWWQNIAQQKETITQQKETITQQKETIAQQNGNLSECNFIGMSDCKGAFAFATAKYRKFEPIEGVTPSAPQNIIQIINKYRTYLIENTINNDNIHVHMS